MVDLKLLNLNKNSNKFLFKKKLSLRRKSKSKLVKESFIMISFSILLIYLNICTDFDYWVCFEDFKNSEKKIKASKILNRIH